MRFVGIDLAWGAKNTTAAVTLTWTAMNDASGKSGRLEVCKYEEALLTDDDILNFVRESEDGKGIVLGIDAPLDVPNETGRRPVEAMIQHCFGKYQAGAHPANRQRFGNDVRGERLVVRLTAEHNIRNDFQFEAGDREVRRCLEVFPHPAHVALFGLARTLKYKAKPNRDLASRLAEYARLVAGVVGLSSHDPALETPHWLRVPTDKQGAALKRYEDLLDALICAYVAAYYWRWGNGDRCMAIGDAETGYIVSPVTPEMRDCLESITG